MIQIEITPNPDSLKFLSENRISASGTEEFKKDQNGNPCKSSIDNSLLPYELLKNIIKQIEEKKAYVLFPDAYRIDKMMSKEYELVYVECISSLLYLRLSNIIS